MDASVLSPVHTTNDAHYKDHTTALPYTGIYVINESTNKCTSGVRGDRKLCASVHSPLFSRQNGGEKLLYLEI